jgi:hypothetical protein
LVDALTMIPALDQGWSPGWVPASGLLDEPTLPEL